MAASGASRVSCCGALCWLLPLLCCLVYVPCLQYSEWYVDELFAVLRNADARGETPLAEVFTNDFWGNPLRGGAGSWTHKSYRPLAVLSFMWQFRLLGPELFRPQPLRAFNVATHAANSLLLMLLLRRGLGFSRRWSCLAACLFGAHPAHVENVVYLVGRADLLATSGWLLAAMGYLHVRGSRPAGAPPRFCASVLLVAFCAALAVVAGLCKESGITLLVFVAGIEVSSVSSFGRHSVLLASGILATFAGLAWARLQVTQGTTAAFGFVDTPVQYSDSREVRTWTYLFQHAFYAKLLVFPGSLSWDYSFDSIPLLRATWRDARALAVLAAYLGFSSCTAWSLSGTGRRRMLLAAQHVLVPFVPASNLFFVVGVTVGERLLYPSTVGAAMAFAALGRSMERRQSASASWPRRQLPLLLGYALLAVYVWRCGSRVWEWRSSEALYEADALSWPNSVKTRHQLGTVYHAQNRYEEALREYEASLSVLDDNALTDACVAQIYIETGRFDDAIERFQKILGGHMVGFSRFNIWMLYIDFGFALVSRSRFEEAIPMLDEGLKLNLAVPHGLNALGYAHAHLQNLQQAQDTFAIGLEYDPDNPVIWNNLAVVWMSAGALENAAQGLEKALTLEPEHPTFIHNAIILQRAAANGGVLEAGPRMEMFFSRAL